MLVVFQELEWLPATLPIERKAVNLGVPLLCVERAPQHEPPQTPLFQASMQKRNMAQTQIARNPQACVTRGGPPGGCRTSLPRKHRLLKADSKQKTSPSGGVCWPHPTVPTAPGAGNLGHRAPHLQWNPRSSREDRIRVPAFFSVVYLRSRTLPKKKML